MLFVILAIGHLQPILCLCSHWGVAKTGTLTCSICEPNDHHWLICVIRDHLMSAYINVNLKTIFQMSLIIFCLKFKQGATMLSCNSSFFCIKCAECQNAINKKKIIFIVCTYQFKLVSSTIAGVISLVLTASVMHCATTQVVFLQHG